VGKITASVDTSHYKGVVTKSIRVTTNDPAEQAFVLTLSGDVTRTIDVLPNDTVTLSGMAGKIAPIKVTLQATDKKPFDLLSVQSGDPCVVVELDRPAGARAARRSKAKAGAEKPHATGRAQYVLTMNVRPDAAVARNVVNVAVKTSHPKAPSIAIHVNLAVQGPVQVVPERIFARPGMGVQHVKVRRSDGTPLEIHAVESSSPDVKATLTTEKQGSDYDVAVEYTGEAGKAVDARIIVRTNEPRQQEIQIPLAGRS